MTNPNGRFGVHGGQYIPETLMNAVIELEKAYDHYKNDPEFNRELMELFHETCEKAGIVHDIREVFRYLHTYEEDEKFLQASFFD